MLATTSLLLAEIPVKAGDKVAFLGDSITNQKLVSYNEFIRSLAKEKKCLLADLNGEMQSALADAVKSQPKPHNKSNYLTHTIP